MTHLQFHTLVTYSQRARRELDTDRVRTSLLDWGQLMARFSQLTSLMNALV